MNPVDETIAKLSAAGLLAVPRATQGCTTVQNFVKAYFDANPESTPDRCAGIIINAAEFPQVKALFDTCKNFKQLMPVLQEFFKQIQALCPVTPNPAAAAARRQTLAILASPEALASFGFVLQAGLLDCLMKLLCPASLPAYDTPSACQDLFGKLCPTTEPPQPPQPPAV